MCRYRLGIVATTLVFLAGCGEDYDPASRPGADPQYGQLEQAATVCAKGPTVEGLDVSVWQGTIDWAKVKGAGKQFAIVRVAYGTSKDTKFSVNYPAVKAHGMIRGVYQYFLTGEDATAQANVVIAAVGKLGAGDLPVTADVEEKNPSLSPSAYNAALKTWAAKILAGTGKKPMIYTGRYYWNPYVATSTFATYPLWHAQYTNATCPNIADQWSTWTFWQYRAEPYPPVPGGTCAGISGWVDLDKFNGSLAQLQAFAGVVTNQPAKGYLDGAACDRIWGWAQDPDVPTQSIAARVYVDGVATDAKATRFDLTANLSRADLCTPLGSCTHGFEMATPLAFLNGAAHVVHGYAVDTNGGALHEFSSSPRTLNCAVPAFPVPAATGVRRHVPSTTVMTAWKWDTSDVLVLPDAQVNGFVQGPDVVATPLLVQVTGDPAVYVLENDTLRHVPNPTTMTTWQFAAASVTKVTAADLATHVPGADLLPRPFLVRGSGGPAVYQFDSPPPLWATASADDTPTTLTVGEARAVTFQFQNHGSLAWKPGEVFLAPANPRDHASPLCDAASWKSCQRAVTVSAQTAPGETGSFALTLRAPDAAGTVKECFNLVYADRHWFSDVGQMGPKDDALCRSIDVVAAPAQPDAGEPVVAADAGGIPAGDDAGQDQGAHVDAGKPSAAVTAGCGCGAGGGLTAWPAAIALVGLLKRRRH